MRKFPTADPLNRTLHSFKKNTEKKHRELYGAATAAELPTLHRKFYGDRNPSKREYNNRKQKRHCTVLFLYCLPYINGAAPWDFTGSVKLRNFARFRE